MISKYVFYILLTLLAGVYVSGLFSGLLENDSAQFAVMSMRMVQEHDFWSLYKGSEPYLDKPHLHYWLAALSFKVFGIHEWAYKIPGVLAIFLGAYSVFNLAKLYYNESTGRVAALLFLSAQTIVLSGIDLRTDALLTGFVSFSLWQLILFVKKPGWFSMVFGALAAAMAFSTKGHLALIMIGLPLLGHIVYTKQWKVFLKKEILVGVCVFILGITPILYAFYLQFDLHPDLVIRGRSERSGIFFILWEQSFERLSGSGMGSNSPDYFFFFHTFLWAFLPFTSLAIFMIVKRLKNWKFPKPDQGLFYGLITIFILISFAQFKLPHYINSSMGLWAVLTAGFLGSLSSDSNRESSFISSLIKWQNSFFMILTSLAFVLILWVFPPSAIWVTALFVIGFLICLIVVFSKGPKLQRIVISGVLSIVFVNSVMNLVFYPSLLFYQAGTQMANKINSELKVPTAQIYKWGDAHSWAMDFGLQTPLKSIESIKELETLRVAYLYVNEAQLSALKSANVSYKQYYQVPKYRITRLKFNFLNPKTRANSLEKMYLLKLL